MPRLSLTSRISPNMDVYSKSTSPNFRAVYQPKIKIQNKKGGDERLVLILVV
jgi:hypothetical protein